MFFMVKAGMSSNLRKETNMVALWFLGLELVKGNLPENAKPENA